MRDDPRHFKGDVPQSVEDEWQALTAELAQVKAELTASRRLDGLAWRSMRKQRDQALSHLEALAEPPMHLDDVDYPAAVAAARAFLLSMGSPVCARR